MKKIIFATGNQDKMREIQTTEKAYFRGFLMKTAIP